MNPRLAYRPHPALAINSASHATIARGAKKILAWSSPTGRRSGPGQLKGEGMFVRARARHAGLFYAVLLVTLLATTQPFAAGPRPADGSATRHDGGAAARVRRLPRPARPGHRDDYFPRLAGKPAGYLMNQLVAFRDGRRRYPPMNYLLEYQSRPISAADCGLFCGAAPAAAAASGTDASEAVLARGRAS